MIAAHKGETPFVILILPYLAGIAFGLNYPCWAILNPLIAAFICLAIVFICLNIFYRRLNILKLRWLGGSLITLILLLFGCISVTRYNEMNRADHFSKIKAQYLFLKISNEPVLKGDLLRFTATVEATLNDDKKTPASGTLLVTIKDSLAKRFYYGDELLIPAKYNVPDPPFNPAEFNYKKYLANQNIYYQAFLYPHQYNLLGNNKGNPIIAYALRQRQRLVEKFKQNMHSPEAIAVASTLILGYKADLSSDVLQAYSKTGTIHVLSVSGAHVGIIYLLLTFSLGFLNRIKYGKVLKAVIIIALIWYYSLLTGFSPAVCRAAVMISMVIIGKTYSRYVNMMNVLAVSAFVLLVYDPFFIADVGFQLSYLAVFGMLVFQPIVYQWIAVERWIPKKLWAACSVSIAAQVITFPLSAFYFHQFPVYFLVSNLFIVIPSAVIMYAGLALALLPKIPFLSDALAFILENTILIMNKVLAYVEHAPYAGIGKIWLSTWEYLLCYIIIIALFYFLFDKKIWLIKLSIVCLLLLSASISLKTIRATNTDTITFLNLKKHCGIVFRRGREAVVLADVKPDDKVYQYSIQPYLDSCKIIDVRNAGLDQDIQTDWVKKKYNFVQYPGTRVLLIDGGFQYSKPNTDIQADVLYLTANPDLDVFPAAKLLNYQLVALDGSNSDRRIAKFKAMVKRGAVNYVILKRNRTLITTSK